MDRGTWQHTANGPAALRRLEELRHQRSLPPPGQVEIAADVGRAAAAVLSDRHDRERAADAAARLRARRGDEAPRPNASWVMGRSARWHDPDAQAELRMHELARGRRAPTVLAAGAAGTPSLALRAVRLLRRRPRR